MKAALASILFLFTLTAYGQITSDMSDASRPRQTGEYNLRQQGGQLFLLPKTGPAIPQVIDATNVAGLNALFSGYYPRRIADSLSARKADTASVYTKSAANLRFKDASYSATILNVPGLKDSLEAKLSRVEYQAIAGDTSKAAYRKSESNALFAPKAVTQSGLDNRYTKDQTDGKFLYTSAAELAAKGGFTLTSGIGDSRAALQYAFTHPGPGNGVTVMPGDYLVSGPIDLPSGVHIIFAFGARIRVTNNFPVEDLGGNDGRYVLRVVQKNNVKIENAVIDVQGYQAAPIMLLFADYCTVTGCQLRNWRVGGLGQHGIAVLASYAARISNNTLINGEHGVNVYRSDATLANNNIIKYMTAGAMYNVFSSNFIASNNTVSDCGDVGFDSEGGANNLWIGNTATRCKNGELAIFSGANADLYVSHHLLIRNNTAIRDAQYTTMNATGTSSATAACDNTLGACNFMSLDEGCYESGFEGNTITCLPGAGPALFHAGSADKSNRRVFFKNNTVVSASYFWRILNSDGLTISGNDLRGLPGTEAGTNETRDCHNFAMYGNRIGYDVAKTGGYAVLLNTSNTYATIGPVIDQNTLVNCGQFGFQWDPVNNTALVAAFRSNDLGRLFTANGGLSVTDNGRVKLYNQMLRLTLVDGANNIGNVTAIKRISGPLMGAGTLGQGRDGFNGSLYTAGLIGDQQGVTVSALSLINAGGQGQTLLTVSASSSTLTLNNNTGSTTGGRLTLTLDCYN